MIARCVVPGAFRSGAGMGQAATRNSFYASFSKQGNLAELVAKVSLPDNNRLAPDFKAAHSRELFTVFLMKRPHCLLCLLRLVLIIFLLVLDVS